MRPDRLTVNLRPRSGFEAIDLGFALARVHAGALWRAWLLLVLPAMVLLALAEHALIDILPGSCLLLWWAKPLYDAVVLLVLSRAVFGEQLGLRAALHELRRNSARIVGALTLRRLSASRSFLLPAHLLEGLHGKARAERLRLLREDTSGSARLLTVACVHLEIAVWAGLIVLVYWLTPALYQDGWFEDFFNPVSHLELFGWQLLYVLAVTLVEPFYLAAGFALYLNRRTLLEAWDIEVALKRVQARVAEAAPDPAAGAAP